MGRWRFKIWGYYADRIVLLLHLPSWPLRKHRGVVLFVRHFEPFAFHKSECLLLDFGVKHHAIACTSDHHGICSLFVPVQVMLFVVAFGTTVCCALLSFGLTSQLTLWIYLCVYKFVSSAMFPAMYAWSNRYVTLTVPLTCWLAIISCLIDFGTDNLVGYLLQNVSQISMMYLSFGLACFGFVATAILQVFASLHGDRFERNQEKSGDSLGDGGHQEEGKGCL